MSKARDRLTSLLAKTGLFAMVCGLLCIVGSGASLVLPASAGAYATVAPAPIAGSPGLPDHRVYEQASPPDKNGNEAGASHFGSFPTMFAEPGGDGVVFNDTSGSIGETENGAQFITVAKRAGYGWSSYGAQPAGLGEQAGLFLVPEELGFSADLTQVLFRTENEPYLPQAPTDTALLYDIPDGSVQWLDPPPASDNEAPAAVAGYSADMSTIYYRTNTGFYEWHDGVESVAGVLPDGSVEPGAVAAGLPVHEIQEWLGHNTSDGNELRNQVSEDGTRAFFAAGSPAELYVRETAPGGTQSTVLVSQDALLPDVGGLPAPAPDGVSQIEFPAETEKGEALSAPTENTQPFTSPGYLYASPDGSRAFFASVDQLTSTAPSGGGMYELDTTTNALTYLPGVGASPILVSSQDGSRFIFNGPNGLSLWSEEGGEGGTITLIEPFPVGGEARATPDGSVFVFESAAPFAGFNNGGGHVVRSSNGEVQGTFANQEIYRYDVAEGALSCVSCPPAGVTPNGNAYLGHSIFETWHKLFEDRGISEDGSRIFFDTPDPLVPQDLNTAPPALRPGGVEYVEHGRDVYEWEHGNVYLISSGTSDESSYVGDNSSSGNDVFFSTLQGLAPGDTDEGYDVYDARVPRPGDHPPPPPAPCEGDVCQGPPSEPNVLAEPSSATFSGLGNPTPAVTPPPVVKKTVKCAKGKKLSHGKCVKVKGKKKTRAKKSAHTDRRAGR